jgi:hypothetical protein
MPCAYLVIEFNEIARSTKMKSISKFFFAGLLASTAPLVNAAPIFSISGEGLAAAQAAETGFLNFLNAGYLTEDFDSGYVVGAQSMTINSLAGVGSFTMDLAGTGGACDNPGYDCNDGVAVLDSDESPFGGRFDVSPKNWLDSMDAQELTYAATAGYTSVGFFMTDPNDAGGRFSIGGSSYSFGDIFGSGLGNGKVFYVTLYDETGIEDLTIVTNNGSDGYGIDNVTIGTVPEPGTVALLGMGLLGLVVARRRAKA